MDDKHGEVFRQYDLKVYNMYRARGAFLLDTNQGLKLFKGFEGSKNHLIYENRVKEALQSKGYQNVDLLVETKSGEYVSEDGSGGKYIIKNWFEGEECNLKDIQDVYEASRNLARIHNALEVTQLGEEEDCYVYQSELPDIFEKHNRELKRVRSYIRDKKQRNEFELAFLLSFDSFFQEALKATELIAKSSFTKLYETAKEKHTMCHGNYTYHNILMKKEQVATTNFEKASIGLQVTDLYQFMRKCMEKNDWDMELGKAMLAGYESLRKLPEEEYTILYILLLYPEKFWKVTNFYYNNKKSWIPKRNILKLTSLQQQSPMKAAFLKELFSE